LNDSEFLGGEQVLVMLRSAPIAQKAQKYQNGSRKHCENPQTSTLNVPVRGAPLKWPPSASVGIGGCVSVI
jgi:hypothetical protein